MIIHKLNFTCGLYWHILRKKETTWTHISECESMVWRRLGWIFMDGCFCIVYILWLGYIVVRCLCRRFGYIVCFCIYVVCIYCIQYVYMYDIVCEMYVVCRRLRWIYCILYVRCVCSSDGYCLLYIVCVCRRLGWIYCIFTRSHG